MDEPDYSATPEKTALHPRYELPSLGFAYNALEPAIDPATVYIHYNKHTKGYYKRFVAAIEETVIENLTMPEIMANISKYDIAIRRNGGQYLNHLLYWVNLAPTGEGGEPGEGLKAAIIDQFGSVDEFKSAFSKLAATQFASGWAWLAVDDDGKLFLCHTSNELNPMMDIAEEQGTPLLVIDVWEHAYYLQYQNMRKDYITNFWDIVNWNKVNERFAAR